MNQPSVHTAQKAHYIQRRCGQQDTGDGSTPILVLVRPGGLHPAPGSEQGCVTADPKKGPQRSSEA